jgi:hypothetical protein
MSATLRHRNCSMTDLSPKREGVADFAFGSRGLTFEFTRPAEAGGVGPVRDDATAGTHRAYTACRSGSGVQRVVRPHSPLLRPEQAT